MTKRAVAGLLWFGSVWVTGEVLWSAVGVPRQAGPILGIIAAYLVILDPAGWFWPVPPSCSATSPTPHRVET